MTKTKKSPIKVICDEALRENSELKRCGNKLNGRYLGDTREAKIIENFDFHPIFVKHIISVDDEPVSLINFVNYDPKIRTTAGYYSITYVPTTDKRYVKNRPYVIGQDLVRMRITVSGVLHWNMICRKIPEFAWIKRNSYLTSQLFGIAKLHPGMNFYFSVKWCEYADMIIEKAKKKGIDINNKPFVTYTCTRELEKYYNETFLLAPKKDRHDYQKELDEAEREPSVLEETEKVRKELYESK